MCKPCHCNTSRLNFFSGNKVKFFVRVVSVYRKLRYLFLFIHLSPFFHDFLIPISEDEPYPG